MREEARPWALVLGASSGFGAAAAISFAKAGYNIAGVHLDRRSRKADVASLQERLRACGAATRFFNGNACSDAKRKSCLDELHEVAAPGRVEILLHSLAFGSLRPYLGSPEEATQPSHLAMTLDVMAHSLVWWAQDLVGRGLMSEGGRIFAMTSAGADRVYPSYGAVSAAKAALEAHVRQLAFELRGTHITVNAICAGVTDTPALRLIPGHEKLIEQARLKSGFEPPRLCTVEEVAEALVALSDARLGLLTGNVLRVDGLESTMA